MRIPRLNPLEIFGVWIAFMGACQIVVAVVMVKIHPGWHWTFSSTVLAGGGGIIVLEGLASLAFGRRLRLRLNKIKSASGAGDAN